MANKSSTFFKLVIAAAVLVAGYFGGIYLLRPVAKVTAATTGQAINAVPGSVVVIAEHVVPIKSEVGGVIKSSNLDPGKPVKEGDTLVQIDTRQIDLEIAQSKTNYAAAKAQLEAGSAIELNLATANDVLDYSKRQLSRGEYTQIELEKRMREVKALEQARELEKIADNQKLEIFQNALEQKELIKEKMTIKAPFDGVVTEVLAHQGALIGTESIGTFISLTRIVEGKISEENFGGIALGEKASVTFLGGIAGKDSEYVFDGTVKNILPAADPETQRYIIHLDVNVEPKYLIPGKTGEVTITVDQRQAKAIVPRRALVGNYVYVVKNAHVEVRKVKVGYTWLKGVEITEGLQAGEEVILENQDIFHPGQEVRVEHPLAAEPQKAP
jgi:RND family efflux transporter MFP subunit